MTSGYVEAKDDINGSVLAAWNIFSPAVLGYTGEIRWFGVEPPALPDKSKYFMRVSSRTILEKQSALGRVQADNKKLYRSEGLLFLHIFCPASDKAAASKGRVLAAGMKDYFRDLLTTNGVLFYSARIEELPTDLEWYRFNIIAEFNYEEIG